MLTQTLLVTGNGQERCGNSCLLAHLFLRASSPTEMAILQLREWQVGEPHLSHGEELWLPEEPAIPLTWFPGVPAFQSHSGLSLRGEPQVNKPL